MRRWMRMAVLSAAGALWACQEKEVVPEPLSGNCELLSFEIDQGRNSLAEPLEFTFDRDARTLKGIYLRWLEGDDPDLLIPRFKITGKELRIDGKKIESDKTRVSFAEPFDLTVHAENGDTRTYRVTLNCPQINKELPVLRLQPEKEIDSKTAYVPTTVTLYSPSTTSGWWSPADGPVQVRGRGNSTWILPKKPYRLKFPEKVSPVGLDHAREKSWVILAHDMDKSLVRNHLGFALSRILFDPDEHRHSPYAVLFTPSSQYVNVYMGDRYHGLYQMTDQMNRGEGRIDVEKLTAADGDDPAKITGGHILESDVHSAQPPERFRSGLKNIQINHKYPEDDDFSPSQYRYIEDFVKDAETALYGNDFQDPVKGWRKYFDEKTLVDYVLVKELAADMDGYCSTYLYKKRSCDKLFFGPCWDMDKGWDNEKRGSADYLSQLMIHSGFGMPGCSDSGHWYRRFWQDDSFRAAVRDRWRDRRETLLETVYAELDRLPASMPMAIEANFTVWPFYDQASTEAKMPEKTYEQEIERIRRLTKSRAATLDLLFNQ